MPFIFHMPSIFANMLGGADPIILIAVVALLFGSSQLPKLARSLGSAKSEFEKGQKQSPDEAEISEAAGPAAPATPPEAPAAADTTPPPPAK